MTSIARIRRLARTPYSITSRPLHAADRIVGRLAADSPVRIAVERGVSAVDSAAQRLLGDSTPTPSDDSTPTPSDTTLDADQPAQSADADEAAAQPKLPGQAAEDRIAGDSAPDDSAVATTDSAQVPDAERAEATAPATAAEVGRVSEDLLEHLHEVPLAGELAAAPEQEKQRMADLRARHLVEEFEAEQRARHNRFQQSQ